MRILIYGFTLLIITTSCNKPLAPEFKSIDPVEIEQLKKDLIIIKANADFYNPNKMKLTLIYGEIDVSIDGNYISTIKREYNMKLNPQTDFTIPLELSISPKKIKSSLLSTALGIISGRKLMIGYKGEIRVKAYGLPVKVPVDDEQEINIRLW